MDTNTVLPLFIGLFCAILLVQGLRRKERDVTGWIVIWAIMIGLSMFAYYAVNAYAALVTGIPFLVLVIIPLFGSRVANRLIAQQQYEAGY